LLLLITMDIKAAVSPQVNVRCVDLAHVASPVAFLNVPDVQAPSVSLIMRNVDPRVASDYEFVQRQNRLRIQLHPPHLQIQIIMED
jgi:hypothetical protein